MKKKRIKHFIRNNHNKIIETIEEYLLINNEKQTFYEFWFSDEVFKKKFINRQTGKEVPKFMIFYENKTINELKNKYLINLIN